MKKKYLGLIIIFSLILIFLAFSAYTLFIYNPIEVIQDEYILGAHRGDSIRQIENTLPAFETALEKEKYKFIEFDIQYTKDKILVVHHDKSLKRLQGKSEKIPDLTYEELNNISGYHIPTYEEVMDLIRDKKPLNIEIKSQGNYEDDLQIADYLIADLETRNLINSTLISSISRELISSINDKYNNKSKFNMDYVAYWNNTKYINTGIIYYITERKITQQIPLINDLFEWFRDTGKIDSMISDWWLSGANYLMIHGTNIDIYKIIRPEIPLNSKVVLWTFDDKMYIILPDKEIWDYEINYGFTPKESLPWWED